MAKKLKRIQQPLIKKQKNNRKNTISNRDTCDALTVTGFAHTTATTGAMAALGVSGPIGWGVGTGMAALYAGGSIACNNMQVKKMKKLFNEYFFTTSQATALIIFSLPMTDLFTKNLLLYMLLFIVIIGSTHLLRES